MKRPRPLRGDNIELHNRLMGICEEYIDCLDEKRSVKDTEHWIFEAAMELIYGEDVWKWVNKQWGTTYE